MQSTPAKPDVSVIICTHDTDRWTELLLAVGSVQRQGFSGDVEVLVVVDGNELLRRRAQVRFGEAVRVLANEHERGLSGARNTGVEAARAPIVLFLDDDAFAAPGWIEAHLRAYDDRRVVGTGGVIDPDWLNGRPSWWPAEFDWVVGCTYIGWAGTASDAPEGEAGPVVIRNPIGANMGFVRELVLEAGGFSSDLGRTARSAAGCEETELAIRILQRRPNGRIVAVPDASVRHRVPAERATLGYFARRCVAEGRSKAAVARTVGASAATSAERDYVVHTLPAAVTRAVRTRRLTRAAAVVLGSVLTSASYAASTVWNEVSSIL